jgi:putative membrane protein
MNFILKLIISALAVMICAYLLPGINIVNNDIITALIVAAVLAFLNTVLKPIMVILTIPVTVLSLGFFLLVINAIIILITARIVDGFEVKGFWYALLFSVVLSFVSSAMEGINQPKNNQPNNPKF